MESVENNWVDTDRFQASTFNRFTIKPMKITSLMKRSNLRLKFLRIGYLFLFMLLLSSSWQNAFGQDEAPPRPIDMMVVIDNTCSNYPMTEVAFGCSVFGSDPEYLRIRGVNLLLARLGLGQIAVEEYQIGAISFGDDPELVSALTPVFEVRDSLAEAIEKPPPQKNTRIVDALLEAYRQLLRSQLQNPDHVQTIILITDGFPVPEEGQSPEEIERIVSVHDDIQHFIILLRNADIFPDEFIQYVEFWQQMQRDYNHVLVYPLEDNSNIVDTYYETISRLEEITPTNSFTLKPGLKLEVYIGEFVRRIVVTAIHQAGVPVGTIAITDPQGDEILSHEPGVSQFRGEFNAVEVISVGPPRLTDELKGQYWTIESTEEIEIYFDRQGSYWINFIEPVVEPPEVKNNFTAVDSHNSYTDIDLKINLIQADGTPITSPQPFRGKVIYSDGTERAIRTPNLIEPDPNGVFAASLDLEKDFPGIYGTKGYLTIVIDAGSGNPLGPEWVPITSARLFMELVPGPTIQSIFPSTIKCYPSQPNNFTLRIDHYDTLDSDSMMARVYDDNDEVQLEYLSNGEFTGNLEILCAQLTQDLDCSIQDSSTFHLEISGQNVDDSHEVVLNRNLPVELYAISCTPTPPPPTITLAPPTQTPTPASVPDTDGDGLLDPEDECDSEPGWKIFNGCPLPRLTFLACIIPASGMVIIILIIIVLVRRLMKRLTPPNGYVMACKQDNIVLEPISIFEIGKRYRTNRVTIGGDQKRAHIFIRKLQPLEFVVVERDENIYILNAKTSKIVETFSALSARKVLTSTDDVNLWIGMNIKILRDVKCEQES